MTENQEKVIFEEEIGFGSLFLNSWRLTFKNIPVPFLSFFLFHLIKGYLSEYVLIYILGVVNDEYLGLIVLNFFNMIFTFFHVFNLSFLVNWHDKYLNGQKKKLKSVFPRSVSHSFKEFDNFAIITIFHFLIGIALPSFPQLFYIINIIVYLLIIYFKIQYFLITPVFAIKRKKRVKEIFEEANHLLTNNWWRVLFLVILNEIIVAAVIQFAIAPINQYMSTFTFLWLMPVKIIITSFIHGNLEGIVPSMMIVLYYTFSAEKACIDVEDYPEGIDFLRYKKELARHFESIDDDEILDDETDLSITYEPCPECGSPIPFFKKSCSKCGLRFGRCLRCNSLITSEDEFCLNCGIQIPDKIRRSI